MNWKKIAAFAVALLASELLAGFVEGVVGDPDSVKTQFLLSTFLSFLFAAAIFWAMAARQEQRPFVHAWLSLLVMAALSLVLAAAVFSWLGGNFHVVLVAAEWLTLIAALVVGTSLGRLARGRAGGATT